MLAFLKCHPFAVEAYFKRSTVLTFALDKSQLQPLIPECLTLDTFEDQYGFLAVAMVQTEDLRPKGFPKFMGNDFFLIGYRIFVRYTTSKGKNLRGLYILKSETDKKRMAFGGNLFTHYNYSVTDILQDQAGESYYISSKTSNLNISINNKADAMLPKTSPFQDWKTARRYAGPLPFTFTYNSNKSEVLIIQGVRDNWVPKPVEVADYKVGFLDSLGLKQAVLANAFVIENIPYYWKKGIKDKWKP